MEEQPGSTGGPPVPRWYAAAIPMLILALAAVVVFAALTA